MAEESTVQSKPDTASEPITALAQERLWRAFKRLEDKEREIVTSLQEEAKALHKECSRLQSLLKERNQNDQQTAIPQAPDILASTDPEHIQDPDSTDTLINRYIALEQNYKSLAEGTRNAMVELDMLIEHLQK